MTRAGPAGVDSVGSQGRPIASERGDPADSTTGPEELRRSAEITLRFGSGLLRRRWASYYAAWALAVTCYFLVPSLLSSTSFDRSSPAVGTALLVGLLIAVSLGSLTVSFVVFGIAERTFALRRATYGSKSIVARETLFRYALVAAAVIGVVILSERSVFAALLSVDTILVVLSLFLTRHLGRAFHPIPVEGWVATASFLVAAGISYGSLLLFSSEAGHEWGWLGAILVWFGCAAYARFGPERTEATT